MRAHLKCILPAIAIYGLSLTAHLAALANPETPGAGSATTQEGSKASPARKATTSRQTKIKLGPLQTGPQAQNPAAAGAQMTIISTLQEQRHAADTEAGQMKLGLHTQTKASP